MILTGSDIRINRIIHPHRPRTVHNGMSYGESHAGYDIRVDQDIVLIGGSPLRLANSIERFVMPNNVLGLVKDKSSWARQGLSVFNTAIEPGWRGYLTLELVNLGAKTLYIKKCDPIAQVIFFRTSGVCVPYTGKYQDQERKPVRARREPEKCSEVACG